VKCTTLLINTCPVVLDFEARYRSLSPMKRLRVPILLTACVCVTTEFAVADAALTLQANETSAQLLPREQGPQQVALPLLEFSLLASFACPSDADAESVTVSIADTQKRFGPNEISDKTSLNVLVSVPASQIAPVTVADFCIDDGPGDEKNLLMPGVATAQVSLRCRGENESFLYFASAVLPVRLYCAPDANQDVSTDR